MTSRHNLNRRIRHRAKGAQWCLGIVVAIGAAACAPSPEPTHQTVEYYRANKDAREAKLVECGNDPGALGQTPDCINAKQAARMDVKSLRDLPPLDLSGGAPKKPGEADPRRQPDERLPDDAK